MQHHKAKNMRKGATVIKLHAGGGIRFGFMRQNNISGRTLSVTDVSSYVFDNDSFASYQLRDEDTDISMIVAEGEKPQDSYLALSFALKEKWFGALFSALPPREWFRLDEGDEVTVATEAVVMPQGWLAPHYKHVLTTKGRKLDGDFRQRNPSEVTEYYSDTFAYVLLVSDDGEHAIEVEKHDNGTLKVSATVYRPLADITETSQFRRPYIVTKKQSDAPVSEAQPELKEDADAIVAANANEETALAFSKTLTLISAQPASDAASQEPTVPESPKPLSDSVSAPQTANNSLLECDTALAVSIIQEAKHNKLSLSDVIRKVIDLPEKICDKVYVPFDFTSEEQAVLAERYGITSGNADEIRAKIVEELQLFAGIK